ncbi:unnamed protein product [Rotaria magnacalcarata]|uniref:Uncharacterized protein n=2 Tax=Rotaria magnacalcarata TaxID=392030 RepID=A0A8S2XYA0_9BILA|nr:unnamed protein product [Rotaria magnacalcarata]
MLGKWLETNKTLDWPNGLGPVMLAMNNSISQSTKKTPYEMVFGQSIRHDHEFWHQLHAQSSNESVLNEEDIPEALLDQFNLNYEIESTNTDCASSNDGNSSNPVLSSTTQVNQRILDPSTTSHKRIRDEAEKCYINTAERQLNKYNRGLKKQKLYQINDIVGLKIADVDRTNTSASTLPCKIIQIIEKDDSSTMFYQVATLDGIIKELFLSIAFVDLSQTVAADLRQLITTNLPTITFIQACQLFTNYKHLNTCKCSGSCDTNRCPCKKNGSKCCTKCHRGKVTLCKNK